MLGGEVFEREKITPVFGFILFYRGYKGVSRERETQRLLERLSGPIFMLYDVEVDRERLEGLKRYGIEDEKLD